MRTNYAVLIPSRLPANLRACCEALRSTQHDLAPIVVAADGEAAFDEASKFGLNAVLIKEPFCFARNVNTAAHLCRKAEVLIIMNDDAEMLTLHGLDLLASAAAKLPEFGIISAGIRGAVNNRDQRSSIAASWVNQVKSKTINLVCAAVRTETWQRIGGLDERFCGSFQGYEIYGGEDDAFSYRLRSEGFKLGVDHRVRVNHGSIPSTFRPDGGSRSIIGTRLLFKSLYGFEIGEK